MSDEGGHDTRKATGQELALILDRAQFLLEILRTSEPAPSPDRAPQIAALEDEVRELEARVAHAERQNDRLMRLYVATYQLHATLDPKEVLGNISEIVVNLVGADRFVLILTNPNGGPASVVLRHGFDEELSERSLIRFAGRTYAGGDPQVDGALAEGRLRWGEGGGSPVVAAVPLNVNGRTVGAIALLRLLGHRRDLGPDDREMLDLLAAHAASALFAAQSCATAEHKLRKLAGILGPGAEVRVSLEGRLSDISVVELLQFVHLGERSGTLRLRDGLRVGSVSVHRGRTVGATCPSALPLGKLLVDGGLVTPAQLVAAEARQAATRPRPSLDAVLVEMKVAAPAAILGAVQDQIKACIYDLVTWAEGAFEFDVDTVETLADLSPAPGQTVPAIDIHTQGALLEGLQRVDERAHAASAGLEAAADDAGVKKRDARPTVPVHLIDPASPWLRSVLQIVSRDVELARKISSKVAVERIRSVRVALRDAGAPGPQEDPPAVLLDLRGGAATANDVKTIRRVHPRALLIVLPPAETAAAALYTAGASAVLAPDADLVAACVMSLVGSVRDSSRDAAVELGVAEGFARVHRLFQDLRSGSLSSTFALNLMAVVSETAERAVLFLVKRQDLKALGAFGTSADGRPLAEATKTLTVSLGAAGALLDGATDGRARAIPFDERRFPSALAALLGPPRTGQALIVPVLAGQGPVAVLYADNGSHARALGRLEAIEISAAQVGMAFENHLLRRQLGARVDGGGIHELGA